MKPTQELIERLRELAGLEERLEGHCSLVVDALREAAARLEELDAEGWRSVEDGVPPRDKFCTVFDIDGGMYHDVFWNGKLWVWDDTFLEDIAHWRPRPAPPMPGQSGGGE